MKAIFEFIFPEDQRDYEIMNQSKRTQSFLWDFSQQLRSWRKYHNDFTDGNDALHKIIDEFYSLLNKHEVNIDL